MEISCLICGDGLKIRRHNVFSAVSDHSQTILFELIQKALGFKLDSSIFESEAKKESIYLCESCFGKINNYDLGISLCEKAQRELEQLLEEKIKEQKSSQSEDRDMKVEEVNVVMDHSYSSYSEALDVEIKTEVESENEYDEMDEEHLIGYDEKGRILSNECPECYKRFAQNEITYESEICDKTTATYQNVLYLCHKLNQLQAVTSSHLANDELKTNLLKSVTTKFISIPSSEELKNIEHKLRSDEAYSLSVSNYIKASFHRNAMIGYKNATKMVFKDIFDREFLLDCSWIPLKDKTYTPLKETEIVKLIIKCGTEIFKDVTADQINEVMKSYASSLKRNTRYKLKKNK